MQVSVSDAGKMVGLSDKTLYRHIDKGKLSSQKDHNGHHQIDISELHRVYGQVRTPANDSESDMSDAKKPSETQQLDIEVEVLKKERDHYRDMWEVEQERRKRAEEKEDEQRDMIKVLQRQLPAPEQEPAGEVAKEAQKEHKRFNLFNPTTWGGNA